MLDFDDIEVVSAFLKDAMSKDEIERLNKSDPDKLKILVQRHFREKIYRKWGIFSMTGNPNNILMWSYYCNHTGFCIEFDILRFPFKFYGPFPINYQAKFEALSIKKIGLHIGVLAQSNLKDKIWQHEKEWRLMIAAPDGQEMHSPNFDILKRLGGHDRKFKYPLEAIKSIALGNRFFEPDEMHAIGNNTLDINLKTNFEQKSIMLDFLATNNIKTHIGLRTGFNKIKFQTAKLERINYMKYKIKVLGS